jgi:hypothetical protein
VDDGILGIINRVADPPYRLFFSHADVELSHLSSREEDGPASLKLRGAFMGSGAVEGSAIFHPEGEHANFEAKVAIDKTRLASLNDLLRAKGNFDVTRGTLTVYSEVRVRDGYVNGYVKPLFRDVEIYDSDQDKHKNVFRKMYEGVLDGVAKLLENRHGNVVTVTSLTGPVEDPRSDTFQIIGGLLQNAFIKSILPASRAKSQSWTRGDSGPRRKKNVKRKKSAVAPRRESHERSIARIVGRCRRLEARRRLSFDDRGFHDRFLDAGICELLMLASVTTSHP